MSIKGLSYYPDFLTKEEEEKLIKKIYKSEWDTRLSRRVQHYGHLYEYNHVNNNNANEAPDIPKWIIKLYNKIVEHNIIPEIDISKLQVIVNEYTPGQGIGKHIDDPKKFGNWIISVSLGSGCEIVFENKKTKELHKKYVDKCSLYKMELDARYLWTHQIMSKKTDEVNENIINRDTRISITFREMLSV